MFCLHVSGSRPYSHIPTYEIYIQLYNKSILKTSALFHFFYSECVSDVCLILYIAETDVRQLSLKKRILNQQYGVFGDLGAQGQAASYFVSKYQ